MGLAILIMVLLFYSSSQPYEGQSLIPLLQKVLASRPLEAFFDQLSLTYAGKIISTQTVGYYGVIEFLIRKFVHFISYFALAFCWYNGLYKKEKRYQTFLLALSISVGYACFDEVHQFFTPNRTALIEDVLLDTVGATLGTCIASVMRSPIQTQRRKKK